MIMPIDYLKLQTKFQPIIMQVRELDLLPNYAKKGRECFKLNERIQFEFRPAFEYDEFVGYSILEIIIYPHYLYNGGKHNGNDFKPTDCIKVLSDVFEVLRINEKHFKELDVVNIEFGVNVIPETDVKEVVSSIKYWKSKPFRRNKAKYSLITDSTKHKQIKAYAKGIDDLDRIKSGEIHPNTFRLEIKSKERKFLKLKLNDLFKDEVYNDFQKRILDELKYIIFLDQNLIKNKLIPKEKNAVRMYLNPDSWKNFLSDVNRDKFNYNRKKYEMICAKFPTIKGEIKRAIEHKFSEWKNSAISTERIVTKRIENQQNNQNKFCNFHLTRAL